MVDLHGAAGSSVICRQLPQIWRPISPVMVRRRHGEAYYRGEKIGFTVSQTVRTPDGFELQEDARPQLTLLGSTSTTTIRTTALVDASFVLQSFAFSLDPDWTIHARLDRSSRLGIGGLISADCGHHVGRCHANGDTSTGRAACHESQHVANSGQPWHRGGTRHHWTILDPATMRHAPVDVRIGAREAYARATVCFRHSGLTCRITACKRPPG